MGKKLNTNQLWNAVKGETTLPIFVGTLTYMGLKKRYEEDIQLLIDGTPLKPLATKEEFNKQKKKFLSEKII